jgi:drug/metabolite transporter (DMT)-like permease
VIGFRRGPAARSFEGTSATAAQPSAAPLSIWLALGAVYIVWGSTYLAIRVAVRTIPPFLMGGFRFIIAGALMYVWAIRRGDRQGDRPTGRQWVKATIIGGFLLLGGNGAVVWAEQHNPSGLTALLVATVPLWMALLDRVVFGKRLPILAIGGLVLGFGGVILLVGGNSGGRFTVAGVIVTLVGALSWATGSLYARGARLPARPLVATSMEMIAGGVLLTLAGVASGELADLHVTQISGESWWGFLYLVVFGSWVGFSSYIWLLRVAPVSLVGTYAYVNPVVAVFLGWVILDEVVTGRTIVAAAIIVIGVAMIILSRSATATGDPAEGPTESGAVQKDGTMDSSDPDPVRLAEG